MSVVTTERAAKKSHKSMIGRNSVPSSNDVYQRTEIAMPPLPKNAKILERVWVLRNTSDLFEGLCMQPTIPFWLAVCSSAYAPNQQSRSGLLQARMWREIMKREDLAVPSKGHRKTKLTLNTACNRSSRPKIGC